MKKEYKELKKSVFCKPKSDINVLSSMWDVDLQVCLGLCV